MYVILSRGLRFIVGLCIFVSVVKAETKQTTWYHIVYLDTASYKCAEFNTTLSGTMVNLYGTILNMTPPNIRINFGLTHYRTGIGFDLVIDSMRVEVYRVTSQAPDIRNAVCIIDNKLRIMENAVLHSHIRMIYAPYTMQLNAKEAFTYEIALDYPHTNNNGPEYAVVFYIWGSYE